MESSKHRVEYLIDVYLSGEATNDERKQLELLYSSAVLKTGYVGDLEIEAIHELRKEGLVQLIAEIRKDKPKKISLWPRIAVAAAVAVVIFGAGLFYFGGDNRLDPVKTAAVANDIAPGKNGATITLANGKVIELSDAKSGVVIGAELKYNDGAVIQGDESRLKSGDVMQMTASTAKGQTYQFTLPDGTKVWLNADSKLEFPSNFVNSKTRNVKLSGEGYFEVAKDKAHPFIVATEDQQVEVLGTHFNLNTFGDEHRGTVTSLLEGSVRVNGKEGSRTLKPGDRGVNTIKGVLLLVGSAEDDVDWKEGFFKFNEERLDEIMTKVSRWYDVEISYADPTLKGKTFNGTVSRFSNVSQLLKKLELTGAVHFKIEGRRIVVDR